ncbi:hypothetical protein ABPG72_014888 [Tetrahymena utriculariae]
MGCGTSHSILEPKGRKIIMMGAIGSGKTSILYQLTKKMQVPAIPTVGHNAEYLQINKEKFVLYDVGARNNDFNQIQHLLESAIALVFMIDASNSNVQVFRESIDLFNQCVKCPYFQGLPIAICLNKQDMAENIYIDEDVIMKNYPLDQIQGNNYKIFKMSYKNKTGIEEPFDWIQNQKLKPSNVKKAPRSPKRGQGSQYGFPQSTEQPQSNGSKALPETQDI